MQTMTRQHKTLNKAILGLILSVFMVLNFSAPILADSNPITVTFNNFTITDAKAFSGVVDDGDLLVIYKYNIGYNSTAYYANLGQMTDYVTFRFIDTDNNVFLGTSKPSNYYTPAYEAIGFGQGVGSFYFTPDETTAASITSTGEYSIQMNVYPGMSTVTIGTFDYAIPSNDWNTGTTDEMKSSVQEYVLELADSLTSPWATNMTNIVNGNMQLSSYAVTYFQKTIPGLIYMTIDILGDSVTNIDSPQINPASDTLVGMSLIELWDAQWDGTWVKDSLTSIGDLLGGMSWKMVTSIAFVVLWVAMAAYAQIKWGTTDPALWGGMTAAAFGVCLGLMEWSVVGVMALLFIFYSAYIVFWRQG